MLQCRIGIPYREIRNEEGNCLFGKMNKNVKDVLVQL